MELRTEEYDGPAVTALTAAVQAEYVVRYGGHDEEPVDPREFSPPHGLMLVGYLDGSPVAMGGFRAVSPGLAEIKRMYVVPEHRGKGLSRVVLAAIEQAAREAGMQRLRLNTGNQQPEAIALYESSGYVPGTPFGRYADSPDAHFYERDL